MSVAGEHTEMRGLVLLLVLLLCGLQLGSSYNVGVGRADVTGPAAEIGMMGYAKQGQNTRGNVNL